MKTSKKIMSGTSAALLVASTLAGPLFAAKTANACLPQTTQQPTFNSAVLSSSAGSSQVKTAKDVAFENLEKATADLNSAKQEVSEAQETRDDALAVKEQKTQEVAEIENSATEIKEEATYEIVQASQASQEQLKQAQDVYDNAISDANAASEKLEETNKKVTEAQQALENAVNELEAVEKASAEEKKQLEEAEATKQTAADELEKSEADVADAEKELEKCETDLENKQTEKAKTDEALVNARAKAESSNGAFIEAQAKVNAAKKALSAAETERDSAQKELNEKQAALKTAQEALARAQEENKANEAAVAKGSLGFFESIGSSYAANIVQNPEATSGLKDSHTEVGAASDATSLDNMKKAIERMAKVNELRTSLGLPELKVYDSLVAISQIQTNFAAVEIDHAKLHGATFNVGENLAWGYSDPFAGWYTKEKDAFDAFYKAKTGSTSTITGAEAYNWARTNYDGDASIGHYLSIINPDYTYTGFAYSNKNTRYRACDGETFTKATDTILKKSGDAVYTFAEYKARFMEYYNKVMGAVDPNLSANVSAAQAEAENAQSVLDGKKSAYEASNAAYSAANSKAEAMSDTLKADEAEVALLEEEIDEQTAEIKTLRANKTAAETDLLVKKQIRDQNVSAFEAASQKLEELKESMQDLTAAKKAVTIANSALEEAKGDKQKAEEELASANSAVLSTFDNLEAAEEVAMELAPYVSESEAEKLFFGDGPCTWGDNQKLTALAAYLAGKQAEYKQAVELLSGKQTELEEANSKYLASEESLKLANANYEVALQKYSQAKEAYESASNESTGEDGEEESDIDGDYPSENVQGGDDPSEEGDGPCKNLGNEEMPGTAGNTTQAAQLMPATQTLEKAEASDLVSENLPQTSDAGDLYWVGGTCLVAAGVSVAAKRKLHYN